MTEYTTTSSPAQPEKIKAFRADRWDGEGSAIVFAKSHVEARRRGAQELDCDFEGIESCRRAPEFDCFSAKGFVPIKDMIASGWWYECCGCGQHVTEDCEGDDGEELSPVFTDHSVWCTPACKAADEKRIRIRKQFEQRGGAAVKRMLLKLYPEAEIQSHHIYASGFRIEQALAKFKFPGAQYGGTIYFRERGMNAVRGKPELFIAAGDLDAWAQYRETVSHAKGE